MRENGKSFLVELENYRSNSDKHLLIETRGTNIIESAINLIDQISSSYSEEESQELQKRLISAIKNNNPWKFKKKIREYRDKDRI